MAQSSENDDIYEVFSDSRPHFLVSELELAGRFRHGVVIRCRCVATQDDEQYEFILGKMIAIIVYSDSIFASDDPSLKNTACYTVTLLSDTTIGFAFSRASAELPASVLQWSESLTEFDWPSVS